MFAALAILVLVLAAKVFWSSDKKLNQEKAVLPSAAVSLDSPKLESAASSTVESQPPVKEPPLEYNLSVPFTPQAPTANWDKTHEEACEEAAILMANRFFAGREIAGPDDAEEGLQEIIDWEVKNLGFFESTTAEETARVIREMLGLKAEIIENPKVEDIKAAIAADKLVLVPSAGRQIGNPFYKSPGPLYHMLLLKGYTPDKFITNDAGTKRGENYPYKFETVLNANHDWNSGDVLNGAKKMIFVFQ